MPRATRCSWSIGRSFIPPTHPPTHPPMSNRHGSLFSSSFKPPRSPPTHPPTHPPPPNHSAECLLALYMLTEEAGQPSVDFLDSDRLEVLSSVGDMTPKVTHPPTQSYIKQPPRSIHLPLLSHPPTHLSLLQPPTYRKEKHCSTASLIQSRVFLPAVLFLPGWWVSLSVRWEKKERSRWR